ncbi:MAG: hypothetical protein ABI402_07840 [Ferruginibacter sp.]
MKKTIQLVPILAFTCFAMLSCKKESIKEPASATEATKAQQTTASLTGSETDAISSAKCVRIIEGVGIAYILKPIGALGTILQIDITYRNSAPNGFLNILLRNPFATAGNPIWQNTHVTPAITGNGYAVIHYDIPLQPFVAFPLELTIKGFPGTGGCCTTKHVFSINY